MRKVFPGLENVFGESSPILTRYPENCTGIRPSSIVDSNAPMMPIIASFITRLLRLGNATAQPDAYFERRLIRAQPPRNAKTSLRSLRKPVVWLRARRSRFRYAYRLRHFLQNAHGIELIEPPTYFYTRLTPLTSSSA